MTSSPLRGAIVRVGPAFRMSAFGRPARFEPDGCEGVYTVVDVRADDLLLVRGDVRPEIPDASEWDVSIHAGRCERLD